MAEGKAGKLFINRELSWLEFNRRVLDLSKERSVPLGEQLRFAAIYGSNLDEFFMIRVGSLYDQTLLKNEMRENKTGMTPRQQLAAIMPKVAQLQEQCDKDVAKLYARLRDHGYEKVDYAAQGKGRQAFWKQYFLRELFPVLSPQIVDRRHPFPFLRGGEIYVGALIRLRKSESPVFGLIPVSTQFEQLLAATDGEASHFMLAEELILQFADVAFGKSNLIEKCLFRVTRNADLTVEEGMFDHDIDYRVVMGELLKKRRKLAAVRLQFYRQAPEGIRAFLLEKLMLPPEQCFVQQAPLDLAFMHRLAARLQKPGDARLFYPPVKPLPAPPGEDLYREVAKRDVLICYPYQSMRPFIRMLFHAARDPAVISIKMTLYRVASDSQVIEALMAAAENGKEVVTIVELRARFDEQNNIEWSHQLEQAGCTVIYGFTDYKVHSKLTLITRRSGTKFEYISAVGTGNYNEKTSELYTDLCILTCDPAVGEEVGSAFNNLAVERLTQRADRLIVAPLCFKTVLLEEMRREMARQAEGGDGRIILKCNSISDKDVIETLSAASQAGVEVDLIVRGICCLQAGVPGLTDHVRVRSLVGRYLEHSRIFAFGQGERLRLYIASGDFLTRNTERRVEVGLRVEDAGIRRTLWDILHLQLADTVNAREMQPDGSYARVKPAPGQQPLDSQTAMYPYLEERQAALRGPKGPARPPLPRQKAPEDADDTMRLPARRGLFARLKQRNAERRARRNGED